MAIIVLNILWMISSSATVLLQDNILILFGKLYFTHHAARVLSEARQKIIVIISIFVKMDCVHFQNNFSWLQVDAGFLLKLFCYKGLC